MVLLGNKEGDAGSPARGKSQQQIEIGMKTEMDRDLKGQRDEDQEETGGESGGFGVGEGDCDGEGEYGIGCGESEEIRDEAIGGYNKEMPPVDDVCPICFDSFNVPCRSNCGHWFCASCILHFWRFRSSIQPCKCPLCFGRIVNLKLEAAQLNQSADDDVDVLKKVHQYNGLYNGGGPSTFHRIRAFPLVMRRIFRRLIDPEVLRCTYYVMRILGMLLALLYERWEFEFVPTGGLGIRRMFDVGASVLVVTLFLVGFGHRLVLRGRVRRFADSHAGNGVDG